MTASYAPRGGLPPQTQLMTGRAVFTNSYAFLPKGVFSDIVTSYLPGWDTTKLWLIARPMSGFSETFSQYVMEVAPGGGSDAPDAEDGANGGLPALPPLVLQPGAQTLQPALAPYRYLPPVPPPPPATGRTSQSPSSAPSFGNASESLVDRYQQALEAQQQMMRGLTDR